MKADLIQNILALDSIIFKPTNHEYEPWVVCYGLIDEVAIDARVSGRPQRAKGNLTDQRLALESKVLSRGLSVAKVVEECCCGRTIDRPGLLKALEYCRKHAVPLVMQDLDRLLRPEDPERDTLNEAEIDKLRAALKGVIVLLVTPPEAISSEKRSAATQRGLRAKGKAKGQRAAAQQRGTTQPAKRGRPSEHTPEEIEEICRCARVQSRRDAAKRFGVSPTQVSRYVAARQSRQSPSQCNTPGLSHNSIPTLEHEGMAGHGKIENETDRVQTIAPEERRDETREERDISDGRSPVLPSPVLSGRPALARSAPAQVTLHETCNESPETPPQIVTMIATHVIGPAPAPVSPAPVAGGPADRPLEDESLEARPLEPAELTAEDRADPADSDNGSRLPARHNEAYRLRKAGRPVQELAKQFGVDRTTIWRWCQAVSDEYRRQLERTPLIGLIAAEVSGLNDLEEQCRAIALNAKSDKGKINALEAARKAAGQRQDLLVTTGILPKQPERLYHSVDSNRPRSERGPAEGARRTDDEVRADLKRLLMAPVSLESRAFEEDANDCT